LSRASCHFLKIFFLSLKIRIPMREGMVAMVASMQEN
jgi:hypothetical protein